MFAYIIKRVLLGLIVVIMVSMSVFALFWYGPTSPAKVVCDRQTNNRCSPERELIYEKNLGYQNPIYEEYGKYAKGVFVGRDIKLGTDSTHCDAPCLGLSYTNYTPIWDSLKEKLPATISLAVGGAILYLAIGIPIGIAAARRRGTTADKALVSSFLFLSSVPYYLFALLMWVYVTQKWQVPFFESTGYTPLFDNPAKWFQGLALAWLALGIFNCTAYTRYSRGAMVETLSEDYIRTAKAKGLPPRTVVYKHGLRSAMVPVITIFGIDVGLLLAGTIFTEQIFGIDGIGRWGLLAVRDRDLPVVSAVALFGAIVMIVSNIIVDLIYSVLDPRVRLS